MSSSPSNSSRLQYEHIRPLSGSDRDYATSTDLEAQQLTHPHPTRPSSHSTYRSAAFPRDDAAFQRKLMEGIDEEEERAIWATEDDGREHGRQISDEDEKVDVDTRFSISDTPPSKRSYADPYSGLMASSSSPRPSSHSSCCGSSRCQTIWTLSCGFALILCVLILFIFLLTKNLNHGNVEELNKNVFKMQLLGQSVLHYDISVDEDLPGLSNLTHNWVQDWSNVLVGDFVLTDLETSLSGSFGGIDWRNSIYSHIAPPTTLDILLQLGITSFVCANNHVYDLETQGIYNILQAFSDRNLTCAGIGMNENIASAGTIVQDRGRKGIEVALVAMASGGVNISAIATPTTAGVNTLRVDANGVPNSDDLAINVAAIQAAVAAPGNDLVTVYHHNHYQQNASADPSIVDQWRIDLAHSFIDLGASMYISHGVPQLQGIEIYKGQPVFYGLGDFMFQSRAGPERWGEQAYEGIVVDMEYGCVSCSGASVPIASIGQVWHTMNHPNNQRQQSSRHPSSFMRRVSTLETHSSTTQSTPSSTSPSCRLASHSRRLDQHHLQPTTRRRLNAQMESGSMMEMPTDDEIRDAEWQRNHPNQAEEYTYTDDTPIDEPVDPNQPLPSLPTPSSPSSASACSCGYRLTSLLLRPIGLLLPNTTSPASMSFNHSFGLPTMNIPIPQALRILERVQTLSSTFGTIMNITMNVGGGESNTQLIDEGKASMEAQVFARVYLG